MIKLKPINGPVSHYVYDVDGDLIGMAAAEITAAPGEPNETRYCFTPKTGWQGAGERTFRAIADALAKLDETL